MSQRRQNPYARPDARTREAKAKGYPARSVFKLEEIDRRLKLFRGGQKVLDLGAAPGSWSLYAAQKVGEKGRVFAIDILAINTVFPPQVEILQGDALTLDEPVFARFAPYDVVISDMAPNTSGSKVRDQAFSAELYLRALAVAQVFGKPGSHFVGKIFMSGDFTHAKQETAKAYSRCQVIRPEGTRDRSSEVFIVGMGRLAAPKPPANT